MSTFDILPASIRTALANANHNWSCARKDDDLIERIKRLDARLAEQHYAVLAEGKPYPIT
jgi:hypothetical protein